MTNELPGQAFVTAEEIAGLVGHASSKVTETAVRRVTLPADSLPRAGCDAFRVPVAMLSPVLSVVDRLTVEMILATPKIMSTVLGSRMSSQLTGVRNCRS